MRRGFMVVLALVLVLASASAFSPPAARAAEVPTTRGTRQMVFRFSGLSYLGISGYNSGIGMRWYIKDGLALRPALNFAWSRTETPPDQGAVNSDASHDRDTFTLFGVELALEKHLDGPPSISPYIGALVSVSDVRDTHYLSVSPDPSAGVVTRIRTLQVDAAGLGILGFEWGFAQALTLGGETRFGVRAHAGKRMTDAIDRPTLTADHITEWSVGFETASLFLAIRW